MLEHGGNLAAAAKQYGIPLANWLDLSTGINPNGYPIPDIPAAIWQKLPSDDDGLKEAACQYYGCPALLPTAGSQAALQALPSLRKPCRVAMPRTMYQEHAKAWQQYGHTITFFDGTPDEACLNQADVLLLCNPNNPTGQLFENIQLLSWHQQLQHKGGWLIVDEAFIDVTPEYSIAAYTHLEGLFVLRSLGKFFGLAGTRVGFLLAAKPILQQVKTLLGPWTIAGSSRYIAIAALLDHAWQMNTRQQLVMQSGSLKQLLNSHRLPLAGDATLFHYMALPKAHETKHFFATHGIWIRVFNNPKAIRLGLPPATKWQLLSEILALYNLNLQRSL
jgi:cobalamin biosynthetic protein CobC